MKNNALKINEKDNVAVATIPIKKDATVVIAGGNVFTAAQDIEIGHKISLTSIPSGSKVFRYGEPIIEATQDIHQGEWVHVHNTKPIEKDQ